MAEEKVTTQKHKSALAAQKVKDATDKTTQSTNRLLSSVKKLAGAYLGIQTAKLAIETSDTITSAQNKLNNLTSGSPEKTEESMDKIYAAAQRSRSSYSGMMSNVSKSMMLAEESFQGNIDNAIRFQEIMAKAYTVGGATAAEQHSSMYQLVQALGSGTLAGDELRSVREGAPLAYKEIERFAQENLKTTKSLKDLASEGVITSDIVVAAIMNAGDKIEKKFKNTKMTFAQAWDQIKNTAMKAFEPALESLNSLLSSDAGQKIIEGIGNALIVLGNTFSWLINTLSSFFNWCADNWSWLKYVIGVAIGVIIALMIKQAAVAIATALVNAWAWLQANWALLLIVASVMAILYVYELWRQAAISLCEALLWVAIIIAAAFLIAGIIIMSIPMLIIAAIIAVLAIAFMFFEEICGAVTWTGMLFKNVGLAVANFFIAIWNWVSTAFMNCIEWIVTAFHNSINWIINFAMGLWNSIKAIASNIGIAFENAWIGAQNAFWSFIQGCLEGIKWLEPAINAIAKAFGIEGFTLSGLIDNVSNKQKDYKDFVSVGDAWSDGYHTKAYESGDYGDLSDAWNSGMSTFDVFQDGWGTDAYDIGANWAGGIKDSINEWGSQFQDPNNGGLGTDLVNMLGLNGSLPDPNNPMYDASGAYDPTGANADILKGLDKIGDNTDDIKDSMDLTDDDLDYLRRLAEMEWRNEFTTAEIKVDMTNNNTVNGEQDLDGIVTYLSDVLREEMSNVAYGVHY